MSDSQISDLSQKLNKLKFWENPKSLDPKGLSGLAEEIASLQDVTESIQRTLSSYQKLRWVFTDITRTKTSTSTNCFSLNILLRIDIKCILYQVAKFLIEIDQGMQLY